MCDLSISTYAQVKYLFNFDGFNTGTVLPLTDYGNFTVTGAIATPYITSTSQMSIFGGPNKFGAGTSIRTIVTTPQAHAKVILRMKFYTYGYWRNNSLMVYADGVLQSNSDTSNLTNYFSILPQNHLQILNGNSYKLQDPSREYDYYLEVKHASSSVNITITTDLYNVVNTTVPGYISNTYGYWGIR